MGNLYCQRGLQTKVFKKNPIFGITETKIKSKRYEYFKYGNGKFNRQKCN